LLCLAKIGFDAMVVFDGNVCHHSKQATIQCQANRQRNNIEIIPNQLLLMSIAEERHSTDSIEERNNFIQQETTNTKMLQH
jgi:hypothetical protein